MNTNADPYALFARYYDLEHAAIDADLEFYRQFAIQARGPVLELGCGTGRVLAALSDVGLSLTGVDSSPAMLRLARERLPAHVQLVEADMRCSAPAQLPDAPYWLAFCALNTFMHLPSAQDQLAALAAARRVVVSGGLLLLDLFVAQPAYLASLDGHVMLEFSTTLPDGSRLDKWTSCTHDLSDQRIDTIVFYDMTDPNTGYVTRAVDGYAMRYVHRFELEHLLARSGWRLLSLYGSYDLEPYGPEAERLIALATWGSARDDLED